MPTHRIEIAAPAADVYARIADPHRRTEWLPELQSTSNVPDRPLQEGDSFLGHPVLLGHRLIGHSTVVRADHDACHLEEHVVVGGSFRTAWTVTAARDKDEDEDGGGTACVVTQRIEFDFPQGTMGRLERWVLERYAARMQRAGLERLATTMCGSAPRPRSRWWPRRSG